MIRKALILLIHSVGVSSLVHYVLKWLLPDLAVSPPCGRKNIAPVHTRMKKQHAGAVFSRVCTGLLEVRTMILEEEFCFLPKFARVKVADLL